MTTDKKLKEIIKETVEEILRERWLQRFRILLTGGIGAMFWIYFGTLIILIPLSLKNNNLVASGIVIGVFLTILSILDAWFIDAVLKIILKME